MKSTRTLGIAALALGLSLAMVGCVGEPVETDDDIEMADDLEADVELEPNVYNMCYIYLNHCSAGSSQYCNLYNSAKNAGYC